MRKILKSTVSPLAGNVLISDPEAALAGRAVFYDALHAIADSSSAPAAVRNAVHHLDSSCRAALRQTDRTRLAFTPSAMWAEVEPIGPCVVTWAKSYQLDVAWLVEDAIWSLLDAENDAGSDGGRLCLAPHGIESRDSGPVMGLGTVSLSFAWHFASQPRPVFTKLILDSLKRHLNAELDRIKDEASAMRVQGHTKTAIERDMRWLVMRVVDKQAATDIVEKLRRDGQPVPDVRAVEIALERASALIGLPLPEVRGAPRATAARTMRSR